MAPHRPARGFRWFDAAVLIAAAAAALVVQRWTWGNVSAEWSYRLNFPEDWPKWVHWRDRINWYEVVCWPYVAVAAPALLLLRLVPPRPSRRRLTVQAGTTACLAVMIATSYHLLDVTLAVWDNSFSNPDAPAGYHWETFHFCLAEWMGYAQWDTGLAVAVAWGVLALGGRLRAEASWIDRAGRLLGAYALIVLATSFTEGW
jgi:hypothetical protein